MGLPVLRTLSLCTCCRHYPGAAAGRMIFARNPDVSAFPERVVGSACASSFSRLARRSLALRPAHSRCHQFVTRIPKASASSLPPWLLRLLPAGAMAGWDLHPLESAALSRRTPEANLDITSAIIEISLDCAPTIPYLLKYGKDRLLWGPWPPLPKTTASTCSACWCRPDRMACRLAAWPRPSA